MKLWKITRLISQLNLTNASAIDLDRLVDHIKGGFDLFVYLEVCGVEVDFLYDVDRAELKAEWKALVVDGYHGPSNPDGGASFLVELLTQGLEYRIGDCELVSKVAGVDEAVNEEKKRQDGLENLYQTYRAKCWWSPIYSLLRHGLWHITSPDGFRAIQIDGWIDGVKGQISWEQSAKSYGGKRGYNSLFDFETPTEEDCIRQWDNAISILHRLPINVLLQLDRDLLKEKLIANSAARIELTSDGFIRCVEAWYPEPIPVSAITKGVLFRDSWKMSFEEFTDLKILEQALLSGSN